MLKIVFLLGRPGSGKSSVAGLIQMFARDHGLSFHSINDYEHLQKMFLREEAESTSLDDRDFLQRGSERCYGFNVKNFAVLSTVLKEDMVVPDVKQFVDTMCGLEPL